MRARTTSLMDPVRLVATRRSLRTLNSIASFVPLHQAPGSAVVFDLSGRASYEAAGGGGSMQWPLRTRARRATIRSRLGS